MPTRLGKNFSFGPLIFVCVLRFINLCLCAPFLLVLRVGCGISLYLFLIIFIRHNGFILIQRVYSNKRKNFQGFIVQNGVRKWHKKTRDRPLVNFLDQSNLPNLNISKYEYIDQKNAINAYSVQSNNYYLKNMNDSIL